MRSRVGRMWVKKESGSLGRFVLVDETGRLENKIALSFKFETFKFKTFPLFLPRINFHSIPSFNILLSSFPNSIFLNVLFRISLYYIWAYFLWCALLFSSTFPYLYYIHITFSSPILLNDMMTLPYFRSSL
ncbi:hypothetical protein BDZ91DRAFT_753533 [Kalaharituber pfeilii]|nr:hypothetical protein BDZ91DRAFT_753533 [Kalaharituber pfeilii]